MNHAQMANLENLRKHRSIDWNCRAKFDMEISALAFVFPGESTRSQAVVLAVCAPICCGTAMCGQDLRNTGLVTFSQLN